MLLPLLSFDLALERLEPGIPELLEELLQGGEAFGPRPVEASGAVSSLAHEPGLPQDVQVLGDRRPRDGEMRRDLARGQLDIPNERQDTAPVRRRDRLECGLHSRNVSRS